ncbi:MAG: cytochrome c [Gammaproteobacteria bacterium]|nr:cytochrome c [Gammaproteobacteria bacterium]
MTAQAGPRLDYMLNCMGCHRAGGEGAPPEVPQLADRVGFYLSVPGGRDYLVQVPGSRQAPLTDAALADVLNYILDEFGGASVPTGTNPYTTEEVTRLRASAPDDIDAVRRSLEVQIEAKSGSAY